MKLVLHLFFKALIYCMKFYWIKTNQIIKKIFRHYLWEIATTHEKAVYLTFDDGPAPEITDWTLNVLNQFDAKATFFCIGENIQKNPAIFQKILDAKHSIGNHTFNHLNGWKTTTHDYIENIEICHNEIKKHHHPTKLLFRPPYGKITSKQANILRSKGYKIIMWDVLSADFDQSISPEQCLKNVLQHVTNGSIVIFHDSLKASKNLQYVLPKVLQYLKAQDYQFKKL